MPRWAYDPPAGAIVEPDSGHAEDGFASAERPPAQWINYLMHYQLAWCDYLRGPAWGQWSRAAHGGTIATLTSVTGLAVDTDDARARSQRYRYAVVGEAAGPTAKIGVSRNGLEWQDRSIPASCTALYGIARVADYWILWGDESGTKRGYSTIADDGSANSAIGTDDATKWSVVAALSEVGGVAWNGGTDAWVAMRGTAGVVGLTYTTNSAASWTTWGSQSWASGSEYGTSIAYDDSRSVYFVAGSLGAIGSWVSSSSAWTNNVGALTGIPTDADVRLVVGGPEDSRTLIAWASYRYDRTTALASTLIWRSTNGGTSWTAVTLPTGMSAITDLIHVDGVWLATSSAAPYLWRSDDDGTNWERVPLPVGDTIANWALQRAVYGDGQIVCTGLTWTVISGRASATSPGSWTSTEPGYLADAGYLRGRRIHTTAPSDGQVYAWNASTSRFEPVSPSSLSGLPWWAVVPPDEVATSDATVTTLATISAATDHLYTVDVLVSAREAARTFSVAWKLLATVSSDGAAATVEDVLITGPTDGGASGCSVTIDASGTDIRVRVTGLGGTSITWGVQGTVQRIGS